MLIHVPGDVGNIEVGIGLIGKLLELRIKGLLIRVRLGIALQKMMTYTSEADFIAKEVKAPNATLCIFEIVIFDESESVCCWC